MTPEEAFNILDQVCAQVPLVRAQQEQVNEALAVVQKGLFAGAVAS